MAKLDDEKGYISTFSQYLLRLAEVTKVDAITFESYSEDNNLPRFTQYKVSELPELLDIAIAYIAKEKSWQRLAA